MGLTGAANTDVRQEVEVVGDEGAKGRWLLAHLPQLIDQGEAGVLLEPFSHLVMHMTCICPSSGRCNQQ